MPIGASRAEQELNDMLAKTLVQKEVMEPMAKIGWSHASPPPPDYSGQPAPAEGAPGKETAPAAGATSGQPAPKPAATPAPETQPKADSPKVEDLVALYESLRDPETGLIMRKYKSVEEAIKGSAHLANMANKAYAERDEALRQLSEIGTKGVAVREPAAAAPAAAPQPVKIEAPSRAAVDKAQADYDAVLSKVAENGGVLDAEAAKEMSKAQVALTEAITDFRAREAEAVRRQREADEKAHWDSVDDYMSKTYPEAANFSEEVALLLKSEPLLAQAVNALVAQGKRREATELAWTSFAKVHEGQVSAAQRAKDEDREADLAARGQVRQEKLNEARRDAGVVVGSPGGAGIHARPNSASTLEEIEAARDQMRREGNAPGTAAARRFRELVIPLDPTFFGPSNG